MFVAGLFMSLTKRKSLFAERAKLKAHEGKVQKKQIERDEWYQEMSTPKHIYAHAHDAKSRPVTPVVEHRRARFSKMPTAPKKMGPARPHPPSTCASPSTTPTSPLRHCQRSPSRQASDRRSMGGFTSTYHTTARARQESHRQAQQAKAAAIRAEKEKQKRRANEVARRESERIARLRAKVRAPRIECFGVRVIPVHKKELKDGPKGKYVAIQGEGESIDPHFDEKQSEMGVANGAEHQGSIRLAADFTDDEGNKVTTKQ